MSNIFFIIDLILNIINTRFYIRYKKSSLFILYLRKINL
nr:MAG TPA: hypothetical protein [Bacteriophage sp.]DAQ24613.1 MAG TPA: hypothetical protein [Caudoviricetes sp.]